MSQVDTSAVPPVVIPPFVQKLLNNYGQKLFTIAATALAGYGLLPVPMEGQFVAGAIGIVGFVGSCALTYFSTKVQHNREVALANAPAAVPPVAPK